MKPPKITHARKICEELGARAVIVIVLARDNVAGASYGETRKECEQSGRTLDSIMDGIRNGTLPVWENAGL